MQRALLLDDEEISLEKQKRFFLGPCAEVPKPRRTKPDLEHPEGGIFRAVKGEFFGPHSSGISSCCMTANRWIRRNGTESIRTKKVAFATEAVQDLRPLTRRASRVLDRLLASAWSSITAELRSAEGPICP